MPRLAIHPGENLADEMTVARKKLDWKSPPFGPRPASPVGDQPKRPTLFNQEFFSAHRAKVNDQIGE